MLKGGSCLTSNIFIDDKLIIFFFPLRVEINPNLKKYFFFLIIFNKIALANSWPSFKIKSFGSSANEMASNNSIGRRSDYH